MHNGSNDSDDDGDDYVGSSEEPPLRKRRKLPIDSHTERQYKDSPSVADSDSGEAMMTSQRHKRRRLCRR